MAEIARMVDAVVVPLAGEGSKHPPRRTSRARGPAGRRRRSWSTPTGCGDAYRAGLLYGMARVHGTG